MSPLASTLSLNFAVICGVLTLLWILSIRMRDAGIIDPFWGTGFILVAWTSLEWNSPAPPRVLLLALLTTLWGLRLSLYLLWRNAGHAEDRRYAAMRAHHGDRFWWVSLFMVFLLQGVILWFVALPIQITAVVRSPAPLGLLDAAGALLWSVGLFFETVGDWQLARFKADPRNAGRVLDRGLWRYTRHPNYFGDFCVWWGLYLVALAAGGAWTVVSPIVMSFFLMRVSGVTLLEQTIAERRPDYAEYQRRTNAFFPGPRKSSSTPSA